MKKVNLLVAILAFSLGLWISPKAEAQAGSSCFNQCDSQMNNSLQACEQYLEPDGIGGWIHSPQYESCINGAHSNYDMCFAICVIELIF